MTWLYTLVFTGLFISSSAELGTINSYEPINPVVPEVAAQKDEIEKFEQSYPLSAKGRVSVSNVNGSIEVIAWDRNEVLVEATKIASTRDVLTDAEIKIDARPDYLSIETEYRDRTWGRDRNGKDRRLEVRYKLSVPRTAVLNEIETVNGSVTAANFVNVTKISTVNGNVNATDLRGAADLSTVNGTVNADFDQLESGTRIELSTVNGQVNLTIPSDANATIKADSLSGGITNGFGLPVRKGEYVGHDLYGRLGSGDVQIKLDSVNGRLAINKKNDGKATSPATNLLSSNPNKRDEGDRELRAASARMRADLRKATDEARRASEEAVRTANRELSKIRIADLKDLKVDIEELKMDTQINEQIKDSLKIQEKVLSRMQDAIFFADTPVVERKTNSFAVEGTPRIVIDAGNCSVRVRGWDKPEVKYILTDYQDLREGKHTNIKESQSKSEINLTVLGGDANWSNGQPTRIEVFVPRKSNLKIKTKGEIRLEGVSGDLDLSGSENSIDVRGSDGKLKVTNTEGVVRVVDFKGDLVATTKEGEIYLDGNFDRIDATSTEGNFVLTIPANADADIHAPADRLAIEGVESKKNPDGSTRLGKGGRDYKFSSVEGSVEIRNRETINSER
jgi:DUF4097 and DUF4098 domain-containing protein YvlB